jgi:hypothetical protein
LLPLVQAALPPIMLLPLPWLCWRPLIPLLNSAHLLAVRSRTTC